MKRGRRGRLRTTRMFMNSAARNRDDSCRLRGASFPSVFHPCASVFIRGNSSSLSAAQRMFTARAARTSTVAREMLDWAIVSSFAQRARTGASVGLKAVLVLNAMKR